MLIFLQETKDNSLQSGIKYSTAESAEEMPRIWCAVVIIFNNLLNYMITIPHNKPECSIHYYLMQNMTSAGLFS